jgi:hypothetical protein
LQNSSYYSIPYFARSGTPFDVTIYGTTTTITPTAANNLIHINAALGAIAGYNYDVVIDGVTFHIETICSGLYDNYQIHFLNKWGGFETMLFNKASKKSYEVEKKHYTQLPYRVSDSGYVSIYDAIEPNKMYEQKTTFASRFKEKLRISTDWLSDDEYKWLYQLIVSPMVYLYDFSGGAFYPVHIINTNYEVNKHIQDNLTNLTIEVEFGTTYKTQFR